MLRTHTYFSSQLRFLHCAIFFPRFQGPLRCRRWTFESFPWLVIVLAMISSSSSCNIAIILFSSSSPPAYIASIRRFGPHQHAPVFRPARLRWRKSCAAVPFVFSCQTPCQPSSCPLPVGLKLTLTRLLNWQWSDIQLNWRCFWVLHHSWSNSNSVGEGGYNCIRIGIERFRLLI